MSCKYLILIIVVNICVNGIFIYKIAQPSDDEQPPSRIDFEVPSRSRRDIADVVEDGAAPESPKRELNQSDDAEYYDDEYYDMYGNNTETEADVLNDIWEHISPKPWTWVLIFFHLLVFIIGLVGNVLVCTAIYRNHSMRTVTNYFIVNLAIADFLVILLCLPPSVIWDVLQTWFFGTILCKIVLYLQTVSITVSILTLTLISIDRWYAICYPLKFKSTTRRAQTAILIIWIISLTFDIPELVVYKAEPNKNLSITTIYFTQCIPTWSNDTDTKWTITKTILLYVVPLMFMTATYVQIVRVLWHSGNVTHQFGSENRDVQFSMVSNTSTRGQLRSRKKAAKMLVSVVGMFAFCFFPVHLLSLLRLTVGLKNTESSRAFALISHWLCYANSAVNPIIYNFMSGKFRKEFHEAINCFSKRETRHHQEMQIVGHNGARKHSVGARSIPSGRSDATIKTILESN